MIYKIIVDKQPMSNPSEEKKEYEIDIDQLYFKHDVYDSLVITHDEDYVMRRLALQDYNVLVELDPPIKEPLENINIELFEGENYIYLYDMTGNKIVAQYLVKNEFNELYVLETEMHTAIRQSANEIELIVGGQVTTLDGAVQDINGELSLKVDKNDNDQIVSMINASADEIYLTSNRLVIDSTNFKLNDEGNITATGGTLGGFNISNDSITCQKNDKYGMIANMSNSTNDFIVIQTGTAGNYQYPFYVRGNGFVHAENMEITGGKLRIPGNGNFLIGQTNGRYVTIDPAQMSIYASANNYITILADNYGNNFIELISGNSETSIEPWEIRCPVFTPTSLESTKKNFEKLQNALDIIKDIDIYKYNLKSEENDTKKHIGFVIGDKYKYSKEVTSTENDGADLYSFVSVCCKAIQEQQEEIQELKARIEKLEKGDK